MKVRIGFVSNSSSSSFCIYGFWLGYNAVKALGKEYEEIEAMLPKGITMSYIDGDGYCIGIGKTVHLDEDWVSLDIEAYLKRREEVVEVAKKFGVENPDIKLHVGTYYS